MGPSGIKMGLARFTAMSLQPTPPSHEQEVICLDSDGEDDVQHTAGPSRASSVKSPAQLQLLTRPVSPPLPQNRKNTNSVQGFPVAGLSADDRIKLEKERIARVKERAVNVPANPVRVVKSVKRGLDETGSPGRSSGAGRPIKTQRTEEVPPRSFYGGDSSSWSESPDSGCGTLGFKKSEPEKAEPVGPRVRLGSEIRSWATLDEDEDGIVLYPDGVVKKTYLEGVERKGDDITIEEVLQKDTLTMAVLSAYQWDTTWIMDKLNVRDTGLILVMQAKEREEKERLKKMFSVLSGVTLVFPDMSGQINCMHSKLMLLFHEDYLRIVVPTANLVKFDWGGHNGIMENTVFLIDLPRTSRDQERLKESELTYFAKELIYFCKKKGYPDNILDALHRIDYSKTAHLTFVHSIGGSHTGDEWKRTGYPGLAAAVRALGLQSGKGLMVDYVTSSVGALNKVFLTNMYRAVMGDNGLKELQSRGKKPAQSNRLTFTARASHPSSSKDDNEPANVELTWESDISDKFNVYFPTHDTVAQSKGGTGAGGTVCFQRKWWDAPTFPKEVMRDCVSTRAKVLMHNKLLFARPAREIKTKNGVVDAYAYVGSANLSESAWGKLVMDKTSKSPKLNVKNWECGVLIPVSASASKSEEFGGAGEGRALGGERFKDDTPQEERNKPLGMEVFTETMPVPMEVPGRRIAQGRKPWFYIEA
ncbi:phospholipase D/nuclease [Terfezia boudieri ATCC MYA-4762]|uniref:Phospholipase D/nuclease n=1 Tax=Terfezia boudieri ATCC MYA-4762 TaxID=1051890 RepID=A0A3N4L6M2_9PEZI|nr:phospholipase D/nuclease [Terfezia boudieri ATCC MYA-4762]